MKDLVEEAAELQVLLEAQGWDFCFIGGLAIQRWSEPRLTKDMDLTLLTGFGDEEPFVDFLLDNYAPRRVDAREFALIHRVLLLQTPTGIGIDIALAGLPFEEAAVRRSMQVEYAPGISLRSGRVKFPDVRESRGLSRCLLVISSGVRTLLSARPMSGVRKAH